LKLSGTSPLTVSTQGLATPTGNDEAGNRLPVVGSRVGNGIADRNE
jgi:hypothetical protein